MTTHKALVGALPLIASALGDKYGVKVVFGNFPTAATDGNTIYMPHLPLEGEAVGILANGFIDHEASHIRHTDMSIFQRANVSGLRKHLLNIVEDIRIEQAMINRYPGTKKNLSRLVKHLAEEGFFSPREDASEADLLLATTLNCGRADALKQDGLYEIANQTEDRFVKTFGKGPMVKLRALLKQAESLGSTQEALDLADKILDMLKNEQEKAEDQGKSEKDQEKAQDEGKSEKDQDQNSGSDSSDDKASDSPSGDSDEDQQKGSDAAEGAQNQSGGSDEAGKGSSSSKSDSKGDADRASAGAGDDSSSNKERAEAMKRALNADDDQIKVKSDLGDAISDQLTQDLHELPVSEVRGGTASREIEMLGHGPAVQRSEVKRETVKMRAKLIAKIETMLRERTYTALSGRKIEGRKLSRVAVGDPRIFRKTEEKRGLDTAIHILVDRSQSMEIGDRISVAMKSTMALMSTFDNIKGVSSAATMFPGVTRLTDFHENVAQTKHRYVQAPMGNTPLGEALLWLIKDMANRREKRKMVIVLTDGMPNDPGFCHKLIKQMGKHDIEVIGVGIETMATEGLFPTSAVIHDVKELPQALFNLIQAKLVQ